MALEQWAVPELRQLLPLDDAELKQIIVYAESLPEAESTQHFKGMLGDSPDATKFISAFNEHRADLRNGAAKQATETSRNVPDISQSSSAPEMPAKNGSSMEQAPVYAPPPGPPPSQRPPPQAAPQPVSQPVPPPASSRPVNQTYRPHKNIVTEAAAVRARDEVQMQQLRQNLQYQYGIYNEEVEPEHEVDGWCNCAIHQYQNTKWRRQGVQDLWSKAVMYPGEKAYNNNPYGATLFSSNPYRFRVVSPYGYNRGWYFQQKPIPSYHARFVIQSIDLNNSLNREAVAKINAREPKHSIWSDNALDDAMSKLAVDDKKRPIEKGGDQKFPDEKASRDRESSVVSETSSNPTKAKTSKLAGFRKSLGIKSSEERAVAKTVKAVDQGQGLREEILAEENGRWPDEQWREIVTNYQVKVGMYNHIKDLRARCPIQYLHLLRAGYFEPIPVAWAVQNSNPLKFNIEANEGWRGITPAWRGMADLAEERCYVRSHFRHPSWVLNHREGSTGTRLKPDFISALNMARERMSKAVEPPPLYYSADDVCHTQHTSEGYSRQVMPPPFRAYDQPEQSTDDTMILLDVSGSMDFDPVRPVYDQYLVTGWGRSTQPKNKDVAKAIVRRFTDAMANHDHNFKGYDLIAFSNQANFVGTITHQNLEQMWRQIRIGGGTRIMPGWQQCKERHFMKHAGTGAIHHPVYGWQAGPDTPILRCLVLLDGECQDMDEFELDLLGLSWAHVTIFLIGVDGCPHHHRHANELSRISEVNHHVSFVDAQGNASERFVTHELLKRHLGYDMTYQEFHEIEELPAYSAT